MDEGNAIEMLSKTAAGNDFVILGHGKRVYIQLGNLWMQSHKLSDPYHR